LEIFDFQNQRETEFPWALEFFKFQNQQKAELFGVFGFFLKNPKPIKAVPFPVAFGMENEALSIKGVSKYFKAGKKRFYALKDVDLSIKEGEVFGFLGPNGAGKTTLMNCVTGMLIPDSGTIEIFGENILEKEDYLEQVNFVSGESRFHWNLTAVEILRFFSKIYNIPHRVSENRIEELIKTFEISSFRNQRFDSLSTGQRTRVILAKALINEPRLLLLDEPTVGLDPDIARKVREKIQHINKERRTTIILTSHYMSEVEQLCKRIAFINKGRIIDVGEVKEIMKSRFREYDLIIDLSDAKNPQQLRQMGLKVSGNRVSTSLANEEGISEIISSLVRKGYTLKDIEVKRPKLEDYFVKLAGEKK
jgi:ABC-2 type transport system ATP-binding protein